MSNATKITAAHVDTIQDWKNEATYYWFLVEGYSDAFGLEIRGDYAMCDHGPHTQILDADGSPLTPGDGETEAVRAAIEPLIEEARNEA